MDAKTALSYTFPKVCSQFSFCFVGQKANKLFNLQSASSLWSLLFQTEPPVLPESMLCLKIETGSTQKFIQNYMQLLDFFDHPPKILVALLQGYDFLSLKTACSLIEANKTFHKDIDIEKYSLFDFSKLPDMQAATLDTVSSWLSFVPNIEDNQKIDMRLDGDYAKLLFSCLEELKSSDKKIIYDYLCCEYSLKNIMWVLQLKVYYDMKKEDMNDILLPLCQQEAKKIFDFAIDDYEMWKDWKYKDFLNAPEEGQVWTCDPRYFFHSSKKFLCKKAISIFHRFPETYSSLFAWFKMKYYELDNIRAATEAVRLDIATKQTEQKFCI